nr:HDOD domain-containing protein [Motiliproteus sp. SC1-56]
MPVFSATVNRIQQVSSSPESDAMALALAVMKDANLSARLLRLANSSHCNRGQGRINVISRAVVLIGFDEIKSLSLTLKLIESFTNDNPGNEITDLLVRSFVTAVICREVAEKAGGDDIEESYTCGLLHGLGEIVVAYTLPDTYKQMLAERTRNEQSWHKIQVDNLGGLFSDLGQDLAESWGFPQTVVQSMDALSAEGLRGNARLNFHLASLGDQVLQLVYGHDRSGKHKLNELLTQLSKKTRVDSDDLHGSLNKAFKMACDLARDYGIPKQRLIPPLRDSGDEPLDEFNRKVAYYIHTRQDVSDEDAPAPAAAQQQPERQSALAQRQLTCLQEIGALVEAQTPIQKVLAKVVEAIHESTGCNRAGFCLLSADRQKLTMKIARGEQIEAMRTFFELSRKSQADTFFFRLLAKGSPLLVIDCQEPSWSERLPGHFLTQVNPRGFILAPLGVGSKPLGFLYADKLSSANPVNEEDFRAFNQFFMQTKMALAYSQQRGTSTPGSGKSAKP